ncbi:MAG: AbrB/MazE/SpoVT family DNA-binding domain-containing protein [Patescibacteria group bacterium]
MNKEAEARTQKIIKTGNSAALTIPAGFIKALNLKVGDQVLTQLDFYEGSITYKFVDIRQLRFDNPLERTSLLVKDKKNGKNTRL